MPPDPALERWLRREDAITLCALAAACVLAWIYTVRGAGLGMGAWEQTSLALFPHRRFEQEALGMAGMAMAPTEWWLLSAMWLAMMLAMMTPSAAPTILLYARVHRHHFPGSLAPTGVFALGYFAVWLGFSLLAALLQHQLERVDAMSGMSMGLHSRWAAGGLLLLAGAYQLSPLKQRCLAQCRSPAAFLSRYWRPGARGAFRLGLLHGAYCLGCCAALMLLLFVGGVMNLAWIVALSLLVLAEKWLPAGRAVRMGTAALLLAWGAATFFA